MRSAFAIALSLIAACGLSATASGDTVSIGSAKFDFDAPSPPLSAEQLTLARRYKDAVNRHDEAQLMSLQDASMKTCAVVAREVILKDMGNTIPGNAKVRYFPASPDIAKEMGFGDLAYLSAKPDAVLGIEGRSASAKEIKIVTILRPVRQLGSKFTLIPYCLTPKGKAMFERKEGTSP